MSNITSQLEALKDQAKERIVELDDEIKRLTAERTELRRFVGSTKLGRRGVIMDAIREIAPEQDEWRSGDLARRVSEATNKEVETVRAALSRAVKIGDLTRPRYGYFRPAPRLKVVDVA